MATLATLIALTALLYLIVRYESGPARMEPIRIRDDEAQLRQHHPRRRR
ncbi:MAG: hypothetical protein OIF57_16160 [Marinobacterium sp.]|nr:hypothetical protein [Marinobacterium sp.]